MTEETLKMFEDGLARVNPGREWGLDMIAEVRRLRSLLADAWAWPDGDYSDAKAKRLYDEIDARVKEALNG